MKFVDILNALCSVAFKSKQLSCFEYQEEKISCATNTFFVLSAVQIVPMCINYDLLWKNRVFSSNSAEFAPKTYI